MLDRTVFGVANRTSPEAPIIVLHAGASENRLGGAAAVARLLRGLDLGIDVHLSGVVGADLLAATLREVIQSHGIRDDAVLVDPSRSTTVKERFVGQASGRHVQQILRVDYETTDHLSHKVTESLWTHLDSLISGCDAVLVSDYSKGTCTPELLARLIHACHWQGVPILIDPGHRSDPVSYSGADLIKPNRIWLEAAAGTVIDSVESAKFGLRCVRRKFGWEKERLLVTLDRDGMLLDEPDGEQVHYQARVREVNDVAGAGDMVHATLGACIAGGLSWNDSVEYAVAAAGLEVERLGIVPVTWDKVCGKRSTDQDRFACKIIPNNVIDQFIANTRKQGRKVVFANGCFDLLHAGHIRLLQAAARLGDMLVVAVNSDKSVKHLKGPHRPVIPELQRAEMLAALECVTAVVVFDEETPIPLLHKLHPDVLVKGDEYSYEQVVGGDFVQAYGGRVVTVPMAPGLSTTRLMNNCRARATCSENTDSVVSSSSFK